MQQYIRSCFQRFLIELEQSFRSNMFVKIVTVALTAFIATASANNVWDGLTASWDRNGSTHFYEIPTNCKAAKYEGWTYISDVDPAKKITPLGYEGDRTFVLLCQAEKVIGIEIAFLVSDVEHPKQPVQWNEVDFVTLKKHNGQLFYTVTVWFYNDESNDNRGIWLQKKNGCLEIPTNAVLIPSETDYSLKNCLPTMGTHYNAFNSTTDCAKLNPWFILTHENKTIGLGFQTFGTPTTLGSRIWWETIPRGGLIAALLDPPQCAVKAIEDVGVMSLHIWFVSKPQSITCN